MSAVNKNRDPKENILEAGRNEAFDMGLRQYFDKVSKNNISRVLNDKDRNVKFNTITYRQLNSWDKEGLLSVRREGRKWRRFSIMDAVWIKLISELRDFGFSRKQLKVTKESLESESEKYGVLMPLLEFYVAFAIGDKMPVLVLVFKDGIAIPVGFDQYKIASEFSEMENHLQINLNIILQGFFPHADLKPKYKTSVPIDVDEMQLLAFLRIAEYEKVEVRYKNGKMDLLEGLERIKVSKRLHNILKEQSHAEIKLLQKDGKVVRILRSTKKKIQK